MDDFGVEGDRDSGSVSVKTDGPFISEDGRYVTFTSFATNLVSGDTNGQPDVFVYDRNTNTIERVSVDDFGVEGDQQVGFPIDISADGRYVAFTSGATNLVAGDTNSFMDVFVYDRNTDTIERVSVDDFGVEGDQDSGFYENLLGISSNGRYVTFSSLATNLVVGDTNGQPDVFVYDRNTDTVERVSVNSAGVEGDSFSAFSRISSDGCYIPFVSMSTNLVPGDTNGQADVFVQPLCTTTPTATTLSTTSTTPTITGTWDNNDATELSITVDGTVYTLTSPELDTTTPGTWSLDLSAAGLIPGTYEVLATNNNLFASKTDTTSNELEITALTSTPSSGGGSSITYLCSDTEALNYNDSQFGRHKQSLCEYEYNAEIVTNLTNGATQTNEVSSENNTCPIFTQHLKKGDRDGYQSTSKQNQGVSTILTEVKLLQQTLLEQGFNPGSIDGHYGPLTTQAVAQWQTKHFNQVLQPWNLTHATGWFYQSSERWMNELLGCEDTVTLDNGVSLSERYTG